MLLPTTWSMSSKAIGLIFPVFTYWIRSVSCIVGHEKPKQKKTWVFFHSDQISIEELDIIYKIPHCVPISAHHKWNFDDLLEKMWQYLKLIRMLVISVSIVEKLFSPLILLFCFSYTKPKGQLPDYNSPVVLNGERNSMEDFCNKLHRTIIKEFK